MQLSQFGWNQSGKGSKNQRSFSKSAKYLLLAPVNDSVLVTFSPGKSRLEYPQCVFWKDEDIVTKGESLFYFFTLVIYSLRCQPPLQVATVHKLQFRSHNHPSSNHPMKVLLKYVASSPGWHSFCDWHISNLHHHLCHCWIWPWNFLGSCAH